MSRKSTNADDVAPIPGERRGRNSDFLADTDESALHPTSEPKTGPDDLRVPDAKTGPSDLHVHEAKTGPGPLPELDSKTSSEGPLLGDAQTRPRDLPTQLDIDDIKTRELNAAELRVERTTSSLLPEPTPVDEAPATPFAAAPLEMQEYEHTAAQSALPSPDDDTSRGGASAADDEPLDPPEHTAIDSEVMSKLEEQASDTSRGPSSRDSGRGSKPRRRPTGVDEVLEASQLSEPPAGGKNQPFDEDGSKSVSRSKSVSNINDKPGGTLILEDDGHRREILPPAGDGSAASRLGPAFPDAEDEPRRSSEMPTSARPGVAQAYRGDGPQHGKTRGSGSITSDLPPDDDGWSDFQESSDDWGGRSDSASEVKKPKTDTNQPPKRKRETGRYGPDERENPDPVVRLVSVQGEDKGSFAIPDEDVIVGRDSDNQVVLKDPSVSRKHARFTRTEDGWDLVDLQSGNGTYVNGKRVDRALVKNNDEVRFGSASFRFVDTTDGMRPVDASAAPVLAGNNRIAFFARLRESPRLRAIVYGSAGLSAILLVTLIVLMTHFSGDGKKHAEVFQFYLQGVEHFKQRKWDAAEGFFAAALQHDVEHQRSRRYLDAIATERRAEGALRVAKEKLDQGDLAGAYERALVASDSLFFADDAMKIINIIAKNADERLAKARAALAANDMATARPLLEGLDFYASYRGDLNQLRKQAGLAAIVDDSANILTTYDVPIAKKPPEEKRRTIDTSQKPEPKPRGPTQDAIDALADGRIDDATAKLHDMGDSKEADDLLDRIEKFAQAYDEGREELRVKRPDSAIKLLTQALTTLERMTGPRGEMSRRVRRELADSLYIRGADEYRAGQIEQAEKTLKTATSYSERHQNSVNLLTKIETEKH